jgi:aquaporin Z
VSRYVGEFLGTFALGAMFAGPITGASMNPVRSLALVSGNLDQVWIYLTAPFLGAVLAILSCRLLRDEGCCLVVGDAECLGET